MANNSPHNRNENHHFEIKPVKIGDLRIDPPLLQAPMAGFSDHAFRRILRGFGGVGLYVTEMVSARGAMAMRERGEEEPARLWGAAEEPRPLAVQIWDNDPGKLAALAARLVEEYAVSVIDVNFGCPAKDVSQKAESGAYLLQYPRRMEAIVRRVVDACGSTPVTAKIRLGPSRQRITAVEAALAVAEAGAAAVTVHGRTAADMYRGRADWDAIALVKQSVRRIPVVGNGDIATVEAAIAAFSRYGVDGAMIGRAGLSRPWLFAQIAAALAGRPVPPEPSYAERERILLEHYRLMVERYGEEKGTVLMRRIACRHACGLPGAKQFRADVARAKNREEFEGVVRRDWPKNDVS